MKYLILFAMAFSASWAFAVNAEGERCYSAVYSRLSSDYADSISVLEELEAVPANAVFSRIRGIQNELNEEELAYIRQFADTVGYEFYISVGADSRRAGFDNLLIVDEAGCKTVRRFLVYKDRNY